MAKKVNLDVTERLDITCRQGDTFSITIKLKDSAGDPLPLVTDGYKFSMQVRENLESANQKGATGLVIGVRMSEVDRSTLRVKRVASRPFVTDDLGNLTITALPSVMREIQPGIYIYDLQQIVPNSTTGIDVSHNHP